MSNLNVRIPQVESIEKAIQIFYSRIEIGNKDVAELFGRIGTARITKLKKLAKEQMDEDNVPNWNAAYVNTKAAYKAWGLDIDDLEKRYAKLKKLGA